MVLPPTLPLDPLDLLAGLLVPQPQLYLLASPRLDLSEAYTHARLAPLLTGVFGRLCYRFPRRLGTWSDPELAADPTAPLRVHPEPGVPGELLDDHPLSDRHWELHLFTHRSVSVLALRFDHLLGHGALALRFLGACLDALSGEAAPHQPPSPLLDPAGERSFRAIQGSILEAARARAPWARYHRLDLDLEGVRQAALAHGASFSEGLAACLARAAQATNRAAGRERSLEVLSFRMDPAAAKDPRGRLQVGNLGLLVERLRASPPGALTGQRGDPTRLRANLERLAAVYGLIGPRPVRDWMLRRALAAAQGRAHDRTDRLIVNNLGATHRPFFRPLFFDPNNDTDQLGLVYVDSTGDRLCLQLAPSIRYLRSFPMEDLLARLRASLTAPRGCPPRG